MKTCRYFTIYLTIVLAFAGTTLGQKIQIRAGAEAVVETSKIEFLEDSIRIQQNGEPRELRTDTLQSVTLSSEAALENSAILVELRDGSRVSGTDFSVTEKAALVQLSSKRQLEFQLDHIKLVRLQELNGEQASSWTAISESVANSDLLVAIQRSGALTKIEGLVLGISQGQIQFDFSGQEINVPFDRAAGIRFFSTQEIPAETKTKAVIDDRFGSRWQAQAITSQGEMVTLLLACGAKIELPLAKLSKVDFSYGSSKYLADLDALTVNTTPVFSFPNSVGLDSVLGVRRVEGSTISGSTPGPSIEFVGDGQAVYRVPEGFARLAGTVQLNPVGDYFTPCKVSIELENKTLWEEQLSAPRKSIRFDVPVISDQRIKLTVSSNDAFPTGNTVFWHAPRLLR